MSTFIEFEPQDNFDPSSIVAQCIEQDTRSILLDQDALPPAFFDLSTGIAGELMQRLTTYGIQMASVVPNVSAHSQRFQEFAREANRGHQFRFFPKREAAIQWLEPGKRG
ncbi:DUF4180 domain-containing protein [Candidatus Fermentibacteria bacterium]|nr:DUF4180 domain-containing protein [Candidatus Fermentibacteria bacterium]